MAARRKLLSQLEVGHSLLPTLCGFLSSSSSSTPSSRWLDRYTLPPNRKWFDRYTEANRKHPCSWGILAYFQVTDWRRRVTSMTWFSRCGENHLNTTSAALSASKTFEEARWENHLKTNISPDLPTRITKECFFEVFKYLKTSKQHPFETPGSDIYMFWKTCFLLFPPPAVSSSSSQSSSNLGCTQNPWLLGGA